MGSSVRSVVAFARRAAPVLLGALLSIHASATQLAAETIGEDGIGPAIITDGQGAQTTPKAKSYDADAPVRPHWCNKTSALIDDIHRLGGYSVMRADIGEGRVLERYWNASEEVVIEHGADGTSCLVDLRRR